MGFRVVYANGDKWTFLIVVKIFWSGQDDLWSEIDNFPRLILNFTSYIYSFEIEILSVSPKNLVASGSVLVILDLLGSRF